MKRDQVGWRSVRIMPDEGGPPTSLCRAVFVTCEAHTIAGSEKYAGSLNVEVDRAIRPERGFQSASATMMQRRRLTWREILYEMIALKIGSMPLF
jgi:hypothetical protein